MDDVRSALVEPNAVSVLNYLHRACAEDKELTDTVRQEPIGAPGRAGSANLSVQSLRPNASSVAPARTQPSLGQHENKPSPVHPAIQATLTISSSARAVAGEPLTRARGRSSFA